MAAFFDQTPDVGALRIHDVELRTAVAIGRECDFTAGSRIPYRRDVHGFIDGQTPHVLSVPVGDINLGVAPIAAGGECDLTSVG